MLACATGILRAWVRGSSPVSMLGGAGFKIRPRPAGRVRDSIAVTGSTGYVGRGVRGALARAGIRAVCIARRRFVPRPNETAIVSEPYTSPKVLAALRRCSAMIHLAGVGRQRGGTGHYENVILARDAAAACRRARVGRIVFVSGLGADSGSTGYFASKLDAERAIAASGIPRTIYRASYIVGRGDALSSKIRRLARARRATVPGTGRYIIQPVHIDDACAAITASALGQGRSSRTLDLVGPERISYRRFVRLAAGARAVRTVSAEPALRAAARDPSAGYDLDELAILFGGFGGDHAALKRATGVRFRRISGADI